jgi:hypothetical protein
MKTSSIIAVLAVAGGIATLAAADFKIKSEYTKGNIQSAYNKTKLPPFRFIKENVDSSIALPNAKFEVVAGKTQESSFSAYFVRSAPLTYKVVNDTLYITSELVEKNGNYTREPFMITTPTLEGIESVRGSYKVKHEDAGILSLTARKTSQVTLTAGRVGNLSLDASQNAGFIISSKTPIDEAVIRIADQGSLTLNNVEIRKKSMQLDSSVSLTLQKRSIADFQRQ